MRRCHPISGIPGRSQVLPFVGLVPHLVVISWNCTFPGKEKDLAQKTQPPCPPPRGFGARVLPWMESSLLLQSQKKDLKIMVMRQPPEVRLWEQRLEKWAREPTPTASAPSKDSRIPASPSASTNHRRPTRPLLGCPSPCCSHFLNVSSIFQNAIWAYLTQRPSM